MKSKTFNLNLLSFFYFPLFIFIISFDSQAQSLCDNRGYVIGFFNGVWNMPTQDGAYAGLESLRTLSGNEYNGEPIEYELFYNHTGKSVDATFMQDIAETFIQRANEIDNSGRLSQRFEYLWEVLSDGDNSAWDKLTEGFPASAGVLEALYEDLITKSVAVYSLMVSDPPTQSDYTEHNTRLDELSLQGQKLILIAHSQGNLFANQSFDYISPKVDQGSVQVIHIAPASPTLRGDYILADIDIVINGLRIQGGKSVPDVNIELPFSKRDFSGHKLIDTYLDPAREARSVVYDMMISSLHSATTPEPVATIGFFTITLTWDGQGDVDLHTFEPNGSHVFYEQKNGTVGYLDVDNITSDGPEHYYASCDANQLKEGIYHIGINNFARATGRMATVQAASVHTGVLVTKTLGVGSERGSEGSSSPISVMDVVVTKNENGEYQVSAN
ncbi:MAG: hypothetical protein ACK5NC_10400 [Vibrio sp.]